MAVTATDVQRAFRNSLGRDPSESDVSSYVAVSQSGALTDAQVYQTISNSQEANLISDPVVRFYQAAFGRVPDQAGLDNAQDFVRAYTPSAATYQLLAEGFVTSPEFTNRFGSDAGVTAGYVQALYSTILGRTASASEIDAFVSGANGYDTRAEVLYAVSQSQEAISISDNAVNGFLQNAAEGDAVYSGSIYTTQNGAEPDDNVGDRFTLTTEVGETVTGTSGNDTFNAPTGTLQAFDVVAGGAGADVLNIVNTGGFTLPGTASVSGVETINFLNDAPTTPGTIGDLDVSDFVGATTFNQTGDFAADIGELVNGQTASFSDVALDGTTVTYADDATAASIILNNVDTGARINIEGADLTSITISGSVDDTGAGDATLGIGSEVTGSLSDLTTVNLSLTSDTDIGVFTDALANVTTVNASGSTGDLTLDFTGLEDAASLDLETLTSGSGNDAISLNLANFGAEEVAINGGAGTDAITVNLTPATDQETALTLTGGAGGDTFTFDGGNITADDADTANTTDEAFANSVTISDFRAGDVLELTGFTGFTAQNVVDNALDDLEEDATLFDAVQAVAAVVSTDNVNVTETAKFNFDGSTYVYQDLDPNSAISAGDVLIGLTGIVTLNNNNVVSSGIEA